MIGNNQPQSFGDGLVGGVGPTLSAGGLGIVSVFLAASPETQGTSNEVATGYYEHSTDGQRWIQEELPEAVQVNWVLPILVNDQAAVFAAWLDQDGSKIDQLWVGSSP